MKKIKFLPKFIPLISNEEKVQTRRPVKDILAIIDFNDKEFKSKGGAGWTPSSEEESTPFWYLIEKHCPVKIGEVLYVPEEWMFDHVFGKGIVTRSSMESALPLASKRIKFNSADIMPWEHAKTFIKITDIKVERLQNIENNDIALHEEGIRNDVPNMLSEQSRLDDKNRKFKNVWNDIYFEKGFGWDKNPWVFVYSFERTRRVA